VGPTGGPVKQLGFTISDGLTQPSEIAYVRRLPSDIALFPTNYLRRLKAVGDKALLSEITYFRRFNPYVRRFWPSDVVSFTVVSWTNCRPDMDRRRARLALVAGSGDTQVVHSTARVAIVTLTTALVCSPAHSLRGSTDDTSRVHA
jgi:hypothetical protein